jgi:hypothetical protein
MKIYGDDYLTKTPGQKELIIYEVAKSITAIFKAYKTGIVSKSFDYDYIREVAPEKHYGILGRYYSYKETISAKFDDVSYEPKIGDYEEGRFVPIFEITPYLATPLKRNISTKWGLEMDLASYLIPFTESESSSGEKFFNLFLYGGAVGYDLTWDAFKAGDFSHETFNNKAGDFSHGPLVKYIFDIKNTDIGLSAYLKYKFNDENGHKFQSVPFGLRVSINQDFFSFFIGVEEDLRFTDNKENELMVNTGITIHLPLTWLAGKGGGE